MEEKIRLVLAWILIIILSPITILVMLIGAIWRYIYPKKRMTIKDICTKSVLPLIKEAEKDIDLQNQAKAMFEKIESSEELSSSWDDILACRNFVLSSKSLKEKWGKSFLSTKYPFYCPTCSSKLIWVLYRKEIKGENRRLDYFEGYLSICSDCMKTIDFIQTAIT